MKDFLCDSNLLKVLLAGVRMVGVNDYGRVLKAGCLVCLVEVVEILVVVVGMALAELVYVATKDCVGIWVTCGLYLPSTVEEHVGGLACLDSVHHNADVATGGVLHTNGNVKAAGSKSVLLVLNRSCTNCNVGEKVGKVSVILRVKHLVCTAKSCFVDSTHVNMSDSENSLKHVGVSIGVGLVKHTLVALTCGSGLVGVDSGDDKYLILHLLLHLTKLVYIIKNGILSVGRAGAYDKGELVVFTRENLVNFAYSFAKRLFAIL